MTHVATAAYTDRNVPSFNALRQALACFGRIVPQSMWQALVMSGAVEVPIRVLQKLPRGVSLDAPDNASRFSLVGAPDDADETRVAVVLPGRARPFGDWRSGPIKSLCRSWRVDS